MPTGEEILILGATIADDIEAEVLQSCNIDVNGLRDSGYTLL